jgi:hypothetical protein
MNWLIISISLLFSGILISQENYKNNLGFSLDYKYGAVLPEYQFIHSFVDKNISQVEFSVFKNTLGKSYWEKLYKYPTFGVSFYYSSLGNRAVLGNEFAIYPFVSLQSNPSKKVHLNNKFGLGVGFVTKTFNLEKNYQNVAVGSHLNVHFSYELGLSIDLTKNLSAKSGFSFNHFSNANMKEPNLGINTFSSYLGVIFNPKGKGAYLNPEIPRFIKENEFCFVYAAGGKHTRALQSTVYFTSSLSAEFRRKFYRIFHLGIGLDLFYDSATETELSAPGKPSYKSIYDYRSGIHLSQEFSYDRFSFILQEGIYVGLTDKVTNNIMYNRAIVRYKWTKSFFTHISMKSHLHILDYPEIGFAYYFTK